MAGSLLSDVTGYSHKKSRLVEGQKSKMAGTLKRLCDGWKTAGDVGGTNNNNDGARQSSKRRGTRGKRVQYTVRDVILYCTYDAPVERRLLIFEPKI